MPIQQLIAPQQNSLIDMFQQAEQIKAYRSQNALNDYKIQAAQREAAAADKLRTYLGSGADLSTPDGQRGYFEAGGDPGAFYKMDKDRLAGEKSQADTDRIEQETAEKKLLFMTRFPNDRNAVLGLFAEQAQKYPHLAPIHERLTQIQDPQQFAGEVTNFAMNGLEKLKESRAERNTQSQIAYRDSMMGQPMVVQAPGGTFTYPRDNPHDVTRMDTGPSQIEAADRVRQQLTPQIISKVRDKLSTIALIRKQLENIKAAFGGIKNSYSAGPGGGYMPTEGGASFDASVAGLAPIFRQLTRTPGEGAMSDYESRLAEASLPSRSNYESVTAQQIQQIEDMVNQLESGYTGMMGDQRAPAAGVGASGSWEATPPPAMEPGADPGGTREQFIEEARRRGLVP